MTQKPPVDCICAYCKNTGGIFKYRKVMKMKKISVKRMLLTMGMSIAMLGLAACGSGSGKEAETTDTVAEETVEEGTAYVFEAEYTMLEGLEGLGVSGSPSGIGLAAEMADASNGFYVGNLGVDSPITFKITSDTDAAVTLKAVLGSNILGTCSWDPTSFVVTVNGTPIEYEGFTTDNGSDTSNQQNFKTRNLGEIQLVAGENEIVFVAGDNTYRSNLPSAPSIDCIKITTDAVLTMETYESNIE